MSTATALLAVLSAAAAIVAVLVNPSWISRRVFADLVVTNATIYTSDPSVPFAQSMAVRGGRVLRVGTNHQIRVMLGSGDNVTENWMRSAESVHRDKFRGWVGFNVPISHRITAGCDIFLMPSRFEPCGLNQLYAMRYGTIPVVHCTGGLRDTVENFDPFANGGKDQGTGWTFSPLTKESMLRALWLAIETFREHKSSWEGLMKRGMLKDFTWNTAASHYEQVIEWAFLDPPYVK